MLAKWEWRNVRKDRVINGDLPIEIITYFPFHLVDLPERKDALGSDAPRFVRVCIVANDL